MQELLESQVQRFAAIVQAAFVQHELHETAVSFSQVLTLSKALSQYTGASNWHSDTQNILRLSNLDAASAEMMGHATELGLAGIKCFVECATLRLLTLATYLQVPGNDQTDLAVCKDEASTYREHYDSIRKELVGVVESDLSTAGYLNGSEIGFTVYWPNVATKASHSDPNINNVMVFVKNACESGKPNPVSANCTVTVVDDFPMFYCKLKFPSSIAAYQHQMIAHNRAKGWRRHVRNAIFDKYYEPTVTLPREQIIEKWEADFDI